ncbi:uncharacterized protein LOC130657728 [Hydractinia symbiolongicarpus]|uniref:uncharacterized protein LOC130657728 n=1 Tax=Hydractinia symbiolongicarpus TaxID=13093 RepID=UPI00254B0242|nr:uncharacterized protein LOC130657728 [Hydractinia symbiolongicarpus]
MKLLTVLAVVVVAVVVQVKGDCQNIELVWVLDVSGTISVNQFSFAKTFVKNVMESVPLSSNGNKAGISYFGNEGHKHTYCDDHSTSALFTSAVDTVPQLTGQLTNTEDGMRKGKEILAGRGCGQRPGVNQIMILITDGQANTGGTEPSLFAMASEIRNSGTQLFAIAVGNFDLSQLNQMTDPTNVFQARNFQALSSVINMLTNAVCSTSQPPPSTTTTTTMAPTTTTTTTMPPTTTTTTTMSPSTTTTTTMPPTTTTTTTTTSMPTTTTTTTRIPTPNSGEPACNCSVEKIESYTCLKWTKYEIIKKFEGSCYTDKLKKAIMYIEELAMKAAMKMAAMNTCKKQLAEQIPTMTGNADSVFAAYDECIVIGKCKMMNIYKQLVERKVLLEKELKLEQNGYGGILSSPMGWFVSMMSQKM